MIIIEMDGLPYTISTRLEGRIKKAASWGSWTIDGFILSAIFARLDEVEMAMQEGE